MPRRGRLVQVRYVRGKARLVSARNTTVRDKHRNAIKRTGAPCGICNHDIDYDLPYLDPMSFVVDHIVPIARGGLDTLENKQAAHRACNQVKAAKLPDFAIHTFVTSRTW